MSGRPPTQFGDADLPGLALRLPVAFTRDFTAGEVSAVRHAVRDWLHTAGLSGDAIDGFLMAVHELVINAASHGGGHGVLFLRYGHDRLVAEVTDRGPGFGDRGPQPRPPSAPDVVGGRGLMLARHLSEAMAVVETPSGVTALVMLRVSDELRV